MMTGNGLVERDRGLALGTPVSPLLANQYLGGVDREVGRHGLVVRYADDFAVLCPSLEQADAAWGQMERSLHERGLRLNHAKSYVSTFDKGFAFLGWVFWRDGGHEEHVREQSGAPGWSHPLSRRPGQGRGQERWVS